MTNDCIFNLGLVSLESQRVKLNSSTDNDLKYSICMHAFQLLCF